MALQKLFEKIEKEGYTQDEINNALKEYYDNKKYNLSNLIMSENNIHNYILADDVKDFIIKFKKWFVNNQDATPMMILQKVEDLAGEDLI